MAYEDRSSLPQYIPDSLRRSPYRGPRGLGGVAQRPEVALVGLSARPAGSRSQSAGLLSDLAGPLKHPPLPPVQLVHGARDGLPACCVSVGVPASCRGG
ncbi:hypothetical protein K353_06545 [Kitasatospora sp. SolWspMP-SS2h]|nr:hypothetical protein K353_06545 [Kitasatospora sp. SolWspMP-SS2h]